MAPRDKFTATYNDLLWEEEEIVVEPVIPRNIVAEVVLVEEPLRTGTDQVSYVWRVTENTSDIPDGVLTLIASSVYESMY